MKERVVSFGQDERLVGILKSGKGRVGHLFLNAGIVHRIGPHRLNVTLARAFDAPSFRFDLSGLGDSRPASATASNEDSIVNDISDAIDILFSTGCESVVAFGLCSGADDIYHAALNDNRITGLILMDPYAYTSTRARLERTIEKAADPSRWARAISRLTSKEAERENDKSDSLDLSNMPEPADPQTIDRVFPPRQEFGENLSRLTATGRDILILYTKYVEELLTKPEQFHDTFRDFDFHDRLTVMVNPDVDHTYTLLACQQELVETIRQWLDDRRDRSL
ncbi:MAG: hypothetical protein AAF720_10685 [Pseudomonadota bacterium]